MKLTISCLLLCVLFVQAFSSSDWACHRGSPERTGSSNAPAPDTLHLLWEVDTGSELYSSPVVKNGKVFQVVFEELLCIDLDTGDIQWAVPVPAYHSTPAVTCDKVIVATNRGVSALSVKDGSLVWEYVVAGRFSKRPLEGHIFSSPVVANNRVVVGTMADIYWIVEGRGVLERDEKYLICMDETTGEEEWYVKTILGVFCSPCAVNGKVFASSREMLCVDLETGKLAWNSEDRYIFDPEEPGKEQYSFLESTPTLYHGVLIGGSTLRGWQKVVAMDQHTGDIIWEWVERGALSSSIGLFEGKIYFCSYDGLLHCLSLLDGGEIWEVLISEPREFGAEGYRPQSSPAVADGKIYIGSVEGVFYCLDAHTGEILWKYETGGPIRASPAIVSGKVLISSIDGKIYCFGIDPETYKMKAEKYVEDEIYGRAEEFLFKAKEHAKNSEDIKEIDELMALVDSKKEDYQRKVEKQSEAESLMDRADQILWEKNFEEAQNLYVEASKIYEELNDEFSLSFCKNRIEYIPRIAESWKQLEEEREKPEDEPEDTEDKRHCMGSFLVAVFLLLGIAFYAFMHLRTL